MKTYIQAVLYSLGGLSIFFYIGFFCIWVIARLRKRSVDIPKSNYVLVGASIVVVVGWWTLELGIVDLFLMQRFLAFLATLGSVLWIVRVFRTRPAWKVSYAYAVLLLLSLGICLWQWRVMMNGGYLTAVGGNGDLAAYAQITQHIQRSDFDDAGRIAGNHLGSVARTDVSGVYILLSMLQVVIGRPLNQILIPAMICATILLVLAVFQLIQNHFNTSVFTAGAVALAVQATFMFSYLQGYYFLSQVISMAVLVKLVDSFLLMQSDVGAPGPRARLMSGPTTAIVLSTAMLVLTYPHMVFVCVPIVFVAFVSLRDVLQLRKTIWLYLTSTLIAFGLVWSKIVNSVERFAKLANDQVNGWPLPNILPTHLLGFMNSENAESTLLQWVASGVLVTVVCISTRANAIQRLTETVPIVRVLVVLLGSYLFFALTAAGSYRQWKWITFFMPLTITVLLLPLSAIFVAIFKERSGRVLGAALTVLIVGLSLSRGDKLMSRVQKDSMSVTWDMTQLSEKVDIREDEPINVLSGPYLKSMWPALFLYPHVVHILEPSYYSSPGPSQGPTLIASEAEIPSWVPTARINNDYKIVDYPGGPVSDGVVGLGAKVEGAPSSLRLEVRRKITFSVDVTNVGGVTWLGGGSFRGAVNLGLRIRRDQLGSVYEEIGRQTIVAFPSYVPPGEKAAVDIDLSLDRRGTFVLEITPVSEQVAWFTDINPDFGQRILLEVDN